MCGEKKNISTYKKGKESNPKVCVPTCRLMEQVVSCSQKLKYILKYYNNTELSVEQDKLTRPAQRLGRKIEIILVFCVNIG